ncbi:disease resistance protein Pikm1-TS [Euphorbia lathyris]|uniref:disease resistance protein Pikm1-TS n=1 Tax=Euphorbia lathyris TaxID=212925 RepID=UPI0033140C9D
MTQKLVLKVQMNCQKCRTQALKVAAKADGVNFVGLEGDENEKVVVVIGEGVDAANLTTSLRKKVGPTDIISLAPVDTQ